MPLHDDDKEYFKLVIETSINSAIKPVMDKLSDNELSIQRHEQSLYGAEGNNGLTGDMKAAKRRIDRVNLKIAWATGVATGISIVLGTVIKKLTGG